MHRGRPADDAFERVAGLADQGDALLDLGLEAEISALISLAASAERWASARTSEATTAKPLPASPARAASTAGVQRQQIGLEGDLVDDADDLGDLLGRPLDLAHRRDGVADDHRPTARRHPWRRSGIARLARALGGLADGRGDLVERGGGLFQAGRLLLGAARQVVGGRG